MTTDISDSTYYGFLMVLNIIALVSFIIIARGAGFHTRGTVYWIVAGLVAVVLITNSITLLSLSLE